MNKASFYGVIRLRRFLSLILAAFIIFSGHNVFGAMSSTNYQIQWDEFSTGGGSSSSATYREEGGSSSSEGSDLSSASYTIAQGFRAGVYDRVVEFIPYVQNSSTQVAATAFAANVISGVDRYPVLRRITSASGKRWVKVFKKTGVAPANE